jgi:hypothetical protein
MLDSRSGGYVSLEPPVRDAEGGRIFSSLVPKISTSEISHGYSQSRRYVTCCDEHWTGHVPVFPDSRRWIGRNLLTLLNWLLLGTSAHQLGREVHQRRL